jgi:hypothetical protein
MGPLAVVGRRTWPLVGRGPASADRAHATREPRDDATIIEARDARLSIARRAAAEHMPTDITAGAVGIGMAIWNASGGIVRRASVSVAAASVKVMLSGVNTRSGSSSFGQPAGQVVRVGHTPPHLRSKWGVSGTACPR